MRGVALLLLIGSACSGRPQPTPEITAKKTPRARPPAPPSGPLPRHRAVAIADANFADLAVTPDGTRFATGGDAGPVVVIERKTGAIALRLDERKKARGLAWSKDGKTLAVSYGDLLVTYDANGKRVAEKKGSFGRVAACDEGFLVAHPGGASLIDRALTERAAAAADSKLGYGGPVACGEGLAALGGTDAVVLYALPKLVRKAKLSAADDGDALRDVAIHGGRVAALSNAGSIWLWKTSGERLAFQPFSGGQAASLAFHPGGDVLAAGSGLHRVPSLDLVHRLRPGAFFQGSSFTPDGARLLVGHTAVIGDWDARALLAAPAPDGPVGVPRSLAIHPKGELLAAGEEGRVFVFTPDGDVAATWEANAGGQTSVAFLDDGRIASAGGGAVRLWDSTGGAAGAFVVPGETHEGDLVLRAAAGRLVAGGQGRAVAFDARGKVLVSIGPFEDKGGQPLAIDDLAVHPKGGEVAIAWGARTAVHELPSGRRLRELPPLVEGHGIALAYAPGGARLARAWSMGQATLYPWPKGDGRTFSLPWPDEIAFSSAGDALAWSSFTSNAVGVVDLAGQPRWQAPPPRTPPGWSGTNGAG
jgi:WD40 repeat protein